MLITAVCPRCKTTYQVQDELRGRPMRCPQATCRQVFVVGDAPPEPAPPFATPVPTASSPPGHTVGDLVPLVEAEPLAPAAPPWQQAPPPRRPANAPSMRPATHLPPDTGGPRVVEFGPGNGLAPPPVRRGDDVAEPLEEVPDRPRRRDPHHDDLAPKRRGRWAWVATAVLLLLVAGTIGGGSYFAYTIFSTTEEKLAREAGEQFDKGQFLAAVGSYQKVQEKFPKSDRLDYYRYRADLSELRRRLAEPPDDPGEHLFPHVEQFLKENDGGEHLPADAPGLVEAFYKVVLEHANRHADAPSDEAVAALKKAHSAVAAVKAVKVPKPPDWAALTDAEARLETALARLKRRKELFAEVAGLARNGSYAGLLKLEEWVAQHSSEMPDLATAKEVTDAFAAVYDAHLRSARHVPEAATKRERAAQEDDEPALLFGPLVGGSDRADPVADDGTVLALSRGVLYALWRSTGQVRWAVRVGIDSTALPLRVPARAGVPELILVVSTDTATLSAYALEKSISLRWSYRLPAASLGQPVIVEGIAYVGTTSGEVHEIELSEGKLVGRYLLGQRLTLGGAAEPGSSRVYFAADEGCIYELDVKQRKCTNILYSRHPVGSLRGPPTLVPPQAPPEPNGDGVPGYLVLNQANGLRQVQLRVFELPLRGRASQEVAPRQQPTLEGWTWFTPHRDPEKLVLLSDAGVLGLFGLRQANNRDQAVFSLLPGGGEALGGLMTNKPGGARRGGRAEVVQVQGDDLWVLAGGRMQRLRLGWSPEVGPRLTPAWDAALELGSPLHQSQVIEDAPGRNSLVVVTQPARRAVVFATSLDDETGRIHWQRQLGLVCRTEPLPIPIAGEAPLWLVLDQSAALYALDPNHYQLKPDSTWLSYPKLKRLADSLDENADWPPVVLPSADGRSAHVVAAPGNGLELVVRHVSRVAGERALRVTQGRISLAAAPIGRPALVGGKLLVPLANGQLVRLPASPSDADKPQSGPDWRAARADPEAPGYVTALADGRFLVSDGGRGLNCYRWGEGEDDTHEKLPAPVDAPTLEMKDRIVAPPVRLPPRDKGKATDLVLVADRGGALSLVEVRGDGAMAVRREWDLGGTVTAGPFLRETAEGVRVGCVVDRTNLLWLDPHATDKPWKHEAGSTEIVGEPRLVGGLIVVGDQNGRYVALDPKDGKEVGKGHQLRGSVAAVAGAVELLPGRAVAPLSDGTMMILPLGVPAGKPGEAPEK